MYENARLSVKKSPKVNIGNSSYTFDDVETLPTLLLINAVEYYFGNGYVWLSNDATSGTLSIDEHTGAGHEIGTISFAWNYVPSTKKFTVSNGGNVPTVQKELICLVW